MGSVRLKSNILPGSPASEGRTMTAFVRIVATVGFTTFESSDLLLLLKAARGVFGMVARARTFLRAAINLVPVSKRQRMAEIVVIFPRCGVQNGPESVI